MQCGFLWRIFYDTPRLHQLSIHHIKRFNHGRSRFARWLLAWHKIKKPRISQFRNIRALAFVNPAQVKGFTLNVFCQLIFHIMLYIVD